MFDQERSASVLTARVDLSCDRPGVHDRSRVQRVDRVERILGIAGADDVPELVEGVATDVPPTREPWVEVDGAGVWDDPAVKSVAVLTGDRHVVVAGMVPDDCGDLFGAVDAPVGVGRGGRRHQERHRKKEGSPHLRERTPIGGLMHTTRKRMF